uniref:succinate dehydrogenase assembly factor 4, mitochondrial n=1 Tax=Myxine glutinosa TaxID=7769 RepID=UPI00358F25FF
MALCSGFYPLLSQTRHCVSGTLARRVLSSLASCGAGNCDTKPPKKPHTPVGKYDEFDTHAHREKEPLEKFPDDINPHTGEQGGPRGPEPTRYGDWERKGRCVDF